MNRGTMTEAQALGIVLEAAKEATRKLRTKRNPSDTEMRLLFIQLEAIELATVIAARFKDSENSAPGLKAVNG